jgi:hypothetical protein
MPKPDSRGHDCSASPWICHCPDGLQRLVNKVALHRNSAAEPHELELVEARLREILRLPRRERDIFKTL